MLPSEPAFPAPRIKRLHRRSFGKRTYHSFRGSMRERIVRCIAGILFATVGFTALGQTPALGQRGRGHDDRERIDHGLDRQLAKVLAAVGFSGRRNLRSRGGSAVHLTLLANLGRLLFFDKILSLHNDNSCAGCHSPAFGLATPSRWRSELTITTSWVRTAGVHATSAARHS